MIHYKTQQILSLCSSRGAVHDFELFKRNLNQIPFGAFILADKCYQGIYAVYPNSLLPLKPKDAVNWILNSTSIIRRSIKEE